MPKITPNPSSEPQLEESKVAEPADNGDDPRFFFLSAPLLIAGKEIDKLLIDTSSLSGRTYFKLAAQFRAEHPEIHRTSFNKFSEDIFLSYIIAELNPPMIIDDMQKIEFDDLPLLFLRMQSFLYSARAEKEEKKKAQMVKKSTI